MAVYQTSKRHTQPISIPFLWEEVPGTPKQDWIPALRPIKPEKLQPISSYGLTYSDSEHDGFSDWDIDSYSYETSDDSLSSAPSNGFIFNSAPVQQTSFGLAPGSPDFGTDSSTSSIHTGSSRFSGASFLLGMLFLLLGENSSFRRLEKDPVISNVENEQEKELRKVKRPLLTLEELIVMSRRMSCRKKIISVKKQQSMDVVKVGCLGLLRF